MGFVDASRGTVSHAAHAVTHDGHDGREKPAKPAPGDGSNARSRADPGEPAASRPPSAAPDGNAAAQDSNAVAQDSNVAAQDGSAASSLVPPASSTQSQLTGVQTPPSTQGSAESQYTGRKVPAEAPGAVNAPTPGSTPSPSPRLAPSDPKTISDSKTAPAPIAEQPPRAAGGDSHPASVPPTSSSNSPSQQPSQQQQQQQQQSHWGHHQDRQPIMTTSQSSPVSSAAAARHPPAHAQHPPVVAPKMRSVDQVVAPVDCHTVASAIPAPHPIPAEATLIHTAGTGKPPRLMVYEYNGVRTHRHHSRPARRQEKSRTMLKDSFRRHHDETSNSQNSGGGVDGDASSRNGSRSSSRGTSPDPNARPPPASKKSDSEELDRDAADAVAFANRGTKPPSSSSSMAQQSRSSDADPDELVSEASTKQSAAAADGSLVDRYGQLSSVIGKGSFGVVRLAQRADPSNKNRKLVYAVKEFNSKSSEPQSKYLKRLVSEFYLASSSHHPNIIQTLDSLKAGNNKYCGVMEFCAGGDSYSLIVVAGRLESTEADCFFKQIMRGVAYMHEMGVAHRDLKPENVSLTSRGCCKITDFGNTECFRGSGERQVHSSTNVAGSGPYIAPEEYKKQEFDPRPVDIWAIGVIYMAMCTGRHSWHEAKSVDEFYVKYSTGRKDEHGYEPIERLKMPKRRNVIYSILDPVASRRLTAKQVLNSEWGREITVCAAGEGEP